MSFLNSIIPSEAEFISELIKLDIIVNSALVQLKGGQFKTYKTVCEHCTEALKISAVTLPNRTFYVFTELYREGVQTVPTYVLASKTARSYIINQAMGDIVKWIKEKVVGTKKSASEVNKQIAEICLIIRQQIENYNQPPDVSRRDKALKVLGLEPTDEFLALTTFTAEQTHILKKYIQLAINFREEEQAREEAEAAAILNEDWDEIQAMQQLERMELEHLEEAVRRAEAARVEAAKEEEEEERATKKKSKGRSNSQVSLD